MTSSRAMFPDKIFFFLIKWNSAEILSLNNCKKYFSLSLLALCSPWPQLEPGHSWQAVRPAGRQSDRQQPAVSRLAVSSSLLSYKLCHVKAGWRWPYFPLLQDQHSERLRWCPEKWTFKILARCLAEVGGYWLQDDHRDKPTDEPTPPSISQVKQAHFLSSLVTSKTFKLSLWFFFIRSGLIRISCYLVKCVFF